MAAAEPPQSGKMIVLIAFDCSTYSENALNWYFSNLHTEGNDITVFTHIAMPKMPRGLCGDACALKNDEIQQLVRDHSEECKMIRESVTTICQSQCDSINVVVSPSADSAAKAILKKAQEIDAELIITGTRPDSLRRTLLGSVSSYVLHNSKVPVCICRLEK